MLLALGFPPLPLGFLAYFGLIPFFLALRQTEGKHGFRLGYITGLVYTAGVVYWIGTNSGTYRWAAILSAVLAIAAIALNTALFGLVIGYIHRKGVPGGFWWSALIWVGVEYLRSFGTLVFPWLSLSLSQVQYLPVIQIASITGMYGVSFWVVLLNTALFQYLKARISNKSALTAALVALAIYLIPVAYGTIVLRALPGQERSAKTVKVGIVQPNVDPNQKWDRQFRKKNFALLDSLTSRIAHQDPDIIIWPETAVPSYIRLNRYGYRDSIQKQVNSLGIPLLTGTPDATTNRDTATGETKAQLHNAAVLFQPEEGVTQWYRKIKLVPFAEYIPYDQVFGFVANLELGQGNYTPGRELTVFHVTSTVRTNLSAAICYDSSFPGLIRRFRQRGADWLAVITNDAWFGESSGPYQHAAWSVMRAVENRMPVARSANTGISMIIDPWGRVQERLSLHERGVMAGTIQTGMSGTFYSQHGAVFSFIITLAGLGGLLWGVLR